MKVRQWMRQLLHSFLFILFLVGSFSLSFYLIGLLHFQLSDYVRYIISIVAGISLMIRACHRNLIIKQEESS